MMGLEYLDVEVGRQGAGRLAHQAKQQVHPQREVARLDDGDPPGGLAHDALLVLGHAGRADHQRHAAVAAGLPRQFG